MHFTVKFTKYLNMENLFNYVYEKFLNPPILWRSSLYHLPGPNLDKKCIQLLNAASSNEILRKIYFLIKPLKKVWGRGGDGTAKLKSSPNHTHTQYFRPNLVIGLFLWPNRWTHHNYVVLFNYIIWIYTCQAFVPLYHKDYIVCFMLQGASSLRSNTWNVFF